MGETPSLTKTGGREKDGPERGRRGYSALGREKRREGGKGGKKRGGAKIFWLKGVRKRQKGGGRG